MKNSNKIACITLDYEIDYGDRTEEFNILNDNFNDIKKLGELFRDCDTPVSTFIRTDMFKSYPKSLEALKLISNDYHCHSHTHSMCNFNSEYEIKTCKEVFKDTFGTEPLGYRAPCGVLYDQDPDILLKNGFKFSSSIFPTYRPKKFNHLDKPQTPYKHENSLLELPFASINTVRFVISMSYIKLIGFNQFKLLASIFGLPDVLVIDSHLHDFIYNQKSIDQIPKPMNWVWSRNSKNSLTIYKQLIDFLKIKGYHFKSMTDLYKQYV